MRAFWRALLLVSFQVSVCSGFEWRSQETLPDGVRIPACPGQDVTMSWTFHHTKHEQVVDVEWYFNAYQGAREELLGSLIYGQFLSANLRADHLEFVPRAGIRLLQVTPGHSGTYAVRVNINLNGSALSYEQRVNLNVTDQIPFTSDGHLHAQLEGARYFSKRQEHQLILKCGPLDPFWASQISVLWRTPSNRTLPSTSQENGQYSLALPNPFETGVYTCMVDNSSPAAVCIQSDSPLFSGASVVVDDTDGRLSLSESLKVQMSAQIQAVLDQNTQLAARLQTLASDIAAIKPLTKFDVRLVGGANSHEGRVEIRVGAGSFGTICGDYYWSIANAKVVCRMLGLPTGNVNAWSKTHFGRGTGKTLMANVRCTGNETYLFDCPFPGFGIHRCHQDLQGAGVTCE